MKLVASNKKAYYNYQILEKLEAGIVLTGEEAKAVRAGKIDLTGSFARIINNELWLLNCYIGGIERNRKLLVKKSEIKKLFGKSQIKGLYLIPTRAYFKKNFLKIELATARIKKLYDKREAIKERDRRRGRLD